MGVFVCSFVCFWAVGVGGFSFVWFLIKTEISLRVWLGFYNIAKPETSSFSRTHTARLTMKKSNYKLAQICEIFQSV